MGNKSGKLTPVMLAGTGSDVGKSVLAAGLCRIFKQDGYAPAPFKAQNMSLNSYVTATGLELGRAQAMQAEAAGIACEAEMNPILLKPTGESRSQVVLLGRVAGNMEAKSYYHRTQRHELREAVEAAYDHLAARYNPIVLEGAGSVSELNLREQDLVNLPMARYANAKVILVGDIERGGIFASLYGSLALMQPWERELVGGMIVNKFRGDVRLFEQGRQLLEQICHLPLLGVVPFMDDLQLEEEDSLSLSCKPTGPAEGKINIGVVRLAHLSNFTDLRALELDEQLHVYYSDDPTSLLAADIIVLPGSKNTRGDLVDLRRAGVDRAIHAARERGSTVVGICGGYQMMGQTISDPLGVEGPAGQEQGLGLLPVCTELQGEKTTRRASFRILDSPTVCQGYEIHMGRTTLAPHASPSPLCHTLEGVGEGYMVDKKCWGTYMHGILDNAPAVALLLGDRIPDRIELLDYRQFKESQYDLLADHLRQCLDMEKLYSLLQP